MTSKVNVFRRDARVWSGLLALVLGVVLLDRSFAIWRNDGRNFPSADGRHYPPLPGTKLPGWWANHAVLYTMAGSGLGLMVLSVALLDGGTGEGNRG